MLSEKKSFIAQQDIDFLGMHISHGRYSPGPHIALELLKFPDTNLSRKQIQQFLRTVNYIRDFFPHVAQYTSPLSSALLLEERDKKRFYCAHASGSFKSSQQHYHTIYNEILAVKYGIENFDFYLREHTFKVEMDNSSFPRVLEFKNKFERYDFQTSHIKGSQNIIPDMLSRPPPIHLLSRTSLIPVIYTLSLAMAEPSNDILNLPAKQVLSFPSDLTSLPASSPHPTSQEIKHFASGHLYYYLHLLHTEHDSHQVFCLNKPFVTPFHLCPSQFSQNTLWYLSWLSVLYSHPVLLPLMSAYQHLNDPTNNDYLFWTFVQWFNPLP
ncbi:hypothetical protein ACOSQ4_007180 [Xanthoceras sorbifolium]